MKWGIEDAAIVRARFGDWPHEFVRQYERGELTPEAGVLAARAEMERVWERVPPHLDRWCWPWWEHKRGAAAVVVVQAVEAIPSFWKQIGNREGKAKTKSSASGGKGGEQVSEDEAIEEAQKLAETVQAIVEIIERNGCDCDCECDADGHDGDCIPCLACRISQVLSG